jgi:hypothetical protein
MHDKIRILFLSASPVDKGALRLGAEVRAIEEKIAVAPAHDMFELIQYQALKPDHLRRVLLKYQPHIVHFSGHGSLAEEILLADSSGDSRPLTGAAIAQLFSFFKDQVRIVFFDACFSTPQAKAISQVIDYTLGTSKAMGDKAAIVFAGSFYLTLAFRRTVRESFEIGKMALNLAGISGANMPLLLVKDGVDLEEAFLTLSEETDHKVVGKVRNALLHLASQKAKEAKTDDSVATSRKEITRAGGPDDSRTRGGAKEDIRWRDAEAEEEFRTGTKEDVRWEDPEDEGLRTGTKEDIRAMDVDKTARLRRHEIQASRDDSTRRPRSKIDNSRSASVSEDEKSLIRRELLNGTLTIEQIEGAAETEDDVMAALNRITRRPIYLEVGEAAYRRIQEQLFPPPSGLPPPLPSLMFVGRQDSLTDIKKLLGIGQAAEQTGNVTVVRGWPGVGKTALVGVLARDPEIVKAFPDGVLWTTLEQNPELISKIAQWGRVLGADDLLRIPGLEEATGRLGRLLRDRRMLLIVDDIWSAADALPFVRAAANSSSALLLTTRLTSVAEAFAKFDAAGPDESIYVLPVLAEEDAITLLRYLAPTIVEEHFEECVQLVRELECLPLALHVAGGLLRGEGKIDHLIKTIREGSNQPFEFEWAPLDRAEGAILPTLEALFRRSTDQLDEQTRNHFAYLGMFAPKPATFDVEAMKAVWMVDDPKPIIRELVGNGLLEPAGPGRFQLQALLARHARSLLS